jgi:hypothetical protein
MKIAELLLWAVAGWCAIGALGTTLSLSRGRRAEALHHAAWVAGIAGAYLLILLGVSVTQRQRVVGLGQEQCFGTMCFRVTAVDEVPSLVAGATDRTLQVRIAVSNHGPAAGDQSSIHAYLLDSRGRRWEPLPGLSGNALGTRIASGSEFVSQPMFRIPSDAAGLGLVLTHGGWQPRRFILGDPESLGHRPEIIDLGR